MNYFKIFSKLSSTLNFSYFKNFKTYLVIFIITILLFPSFIKPLSAADFLIGAKAGYFVWDPYLKRVGSSQFDSLENGSGQLYGPVFSILFTSDFSFSVSGLFGEQSASWTSVNFYRPTDTGHAPYTGTFSLKITRIDLDSALSYRLTENFKLIAGYKYQNFDFKMNMVTFRTDTISTPNTVEGGYSNVDIKMPFHGPAIGVGFSTPIGDKFFFASNISALYMWGKFKFNMDSYSYYINSGVMNKHIVDPGDTSGITMLSRGVNFEPTIGASMGEGLPIFTLGVRVQWSQTKFSGGEKLDLHSKWANDYQYGLFVSIVQPF